MKTRITDFVYFNLFSSTNMAYPAKLATTANFVCYTTENTTITGSNPYTLTNLNIVSGIDENRVSFNIFSIKPGDLFIDNASKRWVVSNVDSILSSTLVVEDSIDNAGVPNINSTFVITKASPSSIIQYTNIPNNPSLLTANDGYNTMLTLLRQAIDEVSIAASSPYETTPLPISSVSRNIDDGKNIVSLLEDGTVIKGFGAVDIRGAGSKQMYGDGFQAVKVMSQNVNSNIVYFVAAEAYQDVDASEGIVVSMFKVNITNNYTLPELLNSVTIETSSGEINALDLSVLPAANGQLTTTMALMWNSKLIDKTRVKIYSLNFATKSIFPSSDSTLNTNAAKACCHLVKTSLVATPYTWLVLFYIRKSGSTGSVQSDLYFVNTQANTFSYQSTLTIASNVIDVTEPIYYFRCNHLNGRYVSSLGEYLERLMLISCHRGRAPVYNQSPYVYVITVNAQTNVMKYRDITALGTLVSNGEDISSFAHCVSAHPTNYTEMFTLVWAYSSKTVFNYTIKMGWAILTWPDATLNPVTPASWVADLRKSVKVNEDLLDSPRRGIFGINTFNVVRSLALKPVSYGIGDTHGREMHTIDVALYYYLDDSYSGTVSSPQLPLYALYGKVISIPFHLDNLGWSPNWETHFNGYDVYTLTPAEGNFATLYTTYDSRREKIFTSTSALYNNFIEVVNTSGKLNTPEDKYIIMLPDIDDRYATFKLYREKVVYSDNEFGEVLDDIAFLLGGFPSSYIADRVDTIEYYPSIKYTYGVGFSVEGKSEMVPGDFLKISRSGIIPLNLGIDIGEIGYGHANGDINGIGYHQVEKGLEDYPIALGTQLIGQDFDIRTSNRIFKYYKNVFFVYKDSLKRINFSYRADMIMTRKDDQVGINITREIGFPYGYVEEDAPSSFNIKVIFDIIKPLVQIASITNVIPFSVAKPLQLAIGAAETISGHAIAAAEDRLRNKNPEGVFYTDNTIVPINREFLPGISENSQDEDIIVIATVGINEEQYDDAIVNISPDGQIYIFKREDFRRFRRLNGKGPALMRLNTYYSTNR